MRVHTTGMMAAATALLVALVAPGSSMAPAATASLREPGSLADRGIAATRWAAHAKAAQTTLAPLRRLLNEIGETPSLRAGRTGSGARRVYLAGKHHRPTFLGVQDAAIGASTEVPNRWWYAADARTLALFRPLAALVRAPLDALPPRGAGRGPPTLTSACFIVVASAVAPAASLWHLDWGACARRGAAFTALTPLSGPQMTSERCAAHGLEYEPWDAAPGDLARVYDYARGDAVIFDGRLPHRTAPFTAKALAQVSGGRRLIVSLSFAARGGGATERAAQIRVLEGQTGGYYELDGA